MLVTTKIRREAWLEGRSDSSNTESEEQSWCQLWKIQVPSKIRVFLWRLAQQSIPSADLLHHRQMATTSRCRICGNEDSWRHSLLECTMSRCVWALEEERLLSALSEVTEPDARRWIFTIMEKVSSSDFIRALVTLWAIWHARRKAIHENTFQSPAGTHLFVDRFISEISVSRPTQQN